MPESKKDKTRKDNVVKFKTEQKKMNEQVNEAVAQIQATQNAQGAPNQLPPVREVPTWNSKDHLDLNGLEFEFAYNAIAQMVEQVNAAFQAMQSIMQNNLANGKVKLNFEKLEGTEYVKMTEEEAAPHEANFQNMVAKYKESLAQIEQQKAEAATTPTAEDSGIVDAAGQPVSSN